MTGQRFSLYPATFGYATAQTLDLRQVSSVSISHNTTETPVVPAGALTPAAYLTPRSRPVVEIATMDLATFFGTVSPSSGLLCDEASVLRYQKRSLGGGGFEAGTDHITATAQRGFLYPMNLSAEVDSETGAQLTASFVPLSNGTADPLVYASSVDFTGAPTPTFSSAFFLASPYHNGVEIPGVQSISLDFGIEFRPAPSSPGTFDVIGSKVRQIPVCSFSVAKADEEATMEVIGEAVNTSFAFYLQKADTAGDRVAAATAQHFKLSFTAGKFTRTEIRGSGNDDIAVQFTTKPASAIAVSVASAIP